MSSVSEVDIRDWDQSGTPHKAKNHKGWMVQWLTSNGWVDLLPNYLTKEAAVRSLKIWEKYYDGEFRVYEALK